MRSFAIELPEVTDKFIGPQSCGVDQSSALELVIANRKVHSIICNANVCHATVVDDDTTGVLDIALQ